MDHDDKPRQRKEPDHKDGWVARSSLAFAGLALVVSLISPWQDYVRPFSLTVNAMRIAFVDSGSFTVNPLLPSDHVIAILAPVELVNDGAKPGCLLDLLLTVGKPKTDRAWLFMPIFELNNKITVLETPNLLFKVKIDLQRGVVQTIVDGAVSKAGALERGFGPTLLPAKTKVTKLYLFEPKPRQGEASSVFTTGVLKSISASSPFDLEEDFFAASKPDSCSSSVPLYPNLKHPSAQSVVEILPAMTGALETTNGLVYGVNSNVERGRSEFQKRYLLKPTAGAP